jgi:hypothetical protein
MSSKIRKQYRSHLSNLGVKFGLSPEEYDDHISKIIGEEAFLKFCTTMDAVRLGDTTLEEGFRLFSGWAPTVALFGSQSELALNGGAWLTQRLTDEATDGQQITELGGWNGLLASFVAEKFPKCQIA